MLHFFKITIYVVGSNAFMLFKKHSKAEVSTDIGMLSRSARYEQSANSLMGNRPFLEPKIWLIHIFWYASTINAIAKNDYTSFLAANMMMAMEYQEKGQSSLPQTWLYSKPPGMVHPWMFCSLVRGSVAIVGTYGFQLGMPSDNVAQFLGNWSPMAFGKVHMLGTPHTWSC